MSVQQSEGPSVRLLRVGEQVRHVLSDILQRGDVHDDVLSQHVVSVTEVRMSPDLRHATVFIKSLLGKDEEAVLNEVERGEDHALKAYKEAREKLVKLGRTASDQTYNLVEKQLQGVQRNHDQVRALRNAARARS